MAYHYSYHYSLSENRTILTKYSAKKPNKHSYCLIKQQRIGAFAKYLKWAETPSQAQNPTHHKSPVSPVPPKSLPYQTRNLSQNAVSIVSFLNNLNFINSGIHSLSIMQRRTPTKRTQSGRRITPTMKGESSQRMPESTTHKTEKKQPAQEPPLPEDPRLDPNSIKVNIYFELRKAQFYHNHLVTQLRPKQVLSPGWLIDVPLKRYYTSRQVYQLQSINSLCIHQGMIYDLLEEPHYRERPRKDIKCNCHQSKCEARYCLCFSKNRKCTEYCGCINCNNQNVEGRELMKEKEPDFKGCKCEKSGCLKLYCECRKEGLFCNEKCRCVGCKNMEEKVEKGEQGKAKVKVKEDAPTLTMQK